MTKYAVSIDQSNQQCIHIQVLFSNVPQNEVIYLPKWRPGRYELGNFAKNVRNFRVFDSSGKRLNATKLDTSSWQITNDSEIDLRIEYSYYSVDLNAGSTFLNHEQLYINPVNCFVYLKDRLSDSIELKLAIPESWKVASSMQQENNVLFATDFHEFADSPLVCSNRLQEKTYTSNGTLFHVWFNGECKPDWDKLLNDFQRFTDKQIEKFIEFPVPEYHFIIQVLPIRAYHGVEHQRSTMITLGPSYAVFGEFYPDLLGVSSHELYHTWNVKAIRPIELFPYDYQKENFSKLGYLCEGITTYQGDLMLLKSGVFSDKDYFKELTNQFQKHFDNFGRFNYSVADSSWDTWLDGYTPGTPGRKVSIYTEGCILAFVMDIKIRQFSNNKYGLDECMKRLYFRFALENKGVSELDFRTVLVELAGVEMNAFLDEYVYDTRPFESIVTDALEYIGLELTHKPAAQYSQGRLGMKTIQQGNLHIVTSIYPGSPSDLAQLQFEDEILAVNQIPIHGELDHWLTYFDDEPKTISVSRAGQLHQFTFPEVQRHFYLEYGIQKAVSASSAQQKAFELWKH